MGRAVLRLWIEEQLRQAAASHRRRRHGRRSRRSVVVAADPVVTDWDDAEVDRAPICPFCGVTALAADPAHVVDARFACENPDCDAFGDQVEGPSQ